MAKKKEKAAVEVVEKKQEQEPEKLAESPDKSSVELSSPSPLYPALARSIQERVWEKQILTQEELAFIIGVDTGRINLLVKEYGLPCKQAGKLKLFSLYQVVRWIESDKNE